MKFILIVAAAVLSVASALPYEGIKGHRRVIPKPEPTPEPTPEEVATSNKHKFTLDQTSTAGINKQEENKIQELATSTKMTEQEHKNTQTETDQKKETNLYHSLNQTSMNNINKQEEDKIQEQTTDTKMTDQGHKNTQTETDQKALEEETDYYHSLDKIDHTFETHQGKSKVATEEQMSTVYNMDSNIQQDQQSTKIEQNLFGESSVHHYEGVKGGRRHHHH